MTYFFTVIFLRVPEVETCGPFLRYHAIFELKYVNVEVWTPFGI